MPLYSGPILDAHHHLWDYSMHRHPWLERSPPPDGGGLPMGDLALLRHDFLCDDYLALAVPEGIVASIHIEASWEGGPPCEETAWLDTLDRDVVARWHVFSVDLGSPDAEQVLRTEAKHARAIGVRDIVAWHPEPARSFVMQPGRMDDPDWRRGLAIVAELGLRFDLLLYPHQVAEAERLARDFPTLQIVINHCASPADRSAEGMQQWRDAITRLAACSNIALKVSNPVAYDHNWTLDSLRTVIMTCLAAFGPDRVMFGSDAPVSGLQASFHDLLSAYRQILEPLDPNHQQVFFHDNATRIYGLEIRA